MNNKVGVRRSMAAMANGSLELHPMHLKTNAANSQFFEPLVLQPQQRIQDVADSMVNDTAEIVKGTGCCILESIGSLKVCGSVEFEIPLLMSDIAMAHNNFSGVAVIVIASRSDPEDQDQTATAWVLLCQKEQLTHVSEHLSIEGAVRSDLSSAFHACYEVGVGSFAKVVKGRLSSLVDERVLPQTVAAKTLDADCKRTQVLREVQMLIAAKGNSHIIGYIGTFHDAITNVWTILTECVETGDLLTLLHVNGMPAEKQSRRITLGLLKAFSHLQIRDIPIIHRDVKCENVLVQPNYDAKLCDFGLAFFVNDDREIRRGCGSPGYVAPEMFHLTATMTADQARDIVTPKVDNFGLGAVVAYMLSGKHPFQDRNRDLMWKNNYRARVNYARPRWAKVSREAEEVVKALLQRNPNDRASVAEVSNMPWFGKKGSPLLELELPQNAAGSVQAFGLLSPPVARFCSKVSNGSNKSSASGSTRCLTGPNTPHSSDGSIVVNADLLSAPDFSPFAQ